MYIAEILNTQKVFPRAVVLGGGDTQSYSMRPQPYTKNDTQLRKAGHERRGLPWGRVHQYFPVPVSPENIQMGGIIWTPKIIFMNIYVYIYIYECNSN